MEKKSNFKYIYLTELILTFLRYGHVILSESGNSIGEIIGHSNTINACSLRPNKPFRAVTGGDDCLVNFYHGVPFKFQNSFQLHQKFVNDVRYSPTGNHFISVGSDSKIVLYDGSSGNVISQLKDAEKEHKSSIYSVAWNVNGSKVITSSADGTAKIWDIETSSVIK